MRNVFITMEITRYIIWATTTKDTDEIMETLTPHSSVIVSVTDVIVCVETTLTVANIRNHVGNDMEMACVEMSDSFINKLLKTKFVEEEQKNFKRFLNLTKAPKSINEGLDLINERGGVEYLTDREISALDRLTNKPRD